MSRSQRRAKSTTQPKVGIFAKLSSLLRGPGTSAPSRSRTLLATLALAICALALTAGPASATPPAPDVSIGPVSDVSYASAHVTGKVDPEG